MNKATGNIRIQAPSDMFVLRLLNNRLREMGTSAEGALECNVPPGYYVARCELGGPAMEAGVRVNAGEHVTIAFGQQQTRVDCKGPKGGIKTTRDQRAMPEFTSAAPVAGAVNNHEYYEMHARELVARPEADLCWKVAGARLIVMIRRLSATDGRRVALRGFKLLDVTGAEVTNFSGRKPNTMRSADDAAFGRYAFSVDLPSGGYLLAWPASYGHPDELTCLPIWLPHQGERGKAVCSVYLGVQTGEKFADPSMASMHLGFLSSPDAGYSGGGIADRPMPELSGTATEFALASLRTGRRQLTDRMLRRLLHEKFAYPMGGILGAYMLCERDTVNWKLFDEVIGNLYRLVGDHPDVRALIAVAESRGHSLKKLPALANLRTVAANFPPTVLAGLNALRSAEKSIAPGSLAALAALEAAPTGPWTTFPVPVKTAPPKEPSKQTVSQQRLLATRSFLNEPGLRLGDISNEQSLEKLIGRSTKRSLDRHLASLEASFTEAASKQAGLAAYVQQTITSREKEFAKALEKQAKIWARDSRSGTKPSEKLRSMMETAMIQLLGTGLTEESAKRVLDGVKWPKLK